MHDFEQSRFQRKEELRSEDTKPKGKVRREQMKKHSYGHSSISSFSAHR